MTTKKRILAGIIAVAVVFVMLFSAAFIVHEADHDCIGDGCPTCYQISVCISTLKMLSYAVVAVAVAAVLRHFACVQPIIRPICLLKITLVARKVKLTI